MNIKAYVTGTDKQEDGKAEYGIVIYKSGEPVYRCDELTPDIKIARRFAEMMNSTNDTNF